MSYDKTPWVNGTTPAINATNLNKIETGIDEVHDELAASPFVRDGTTVKPRNAGDDLSVDLDAIIRWVDPLGISGLSMRRMGAYTAFHGDDGNGGKIAIYGTTIDAVNFARLHMKLSTLSGNPFVFVSTAEGTGTIRPLEFRITDRTVSPEVCHRALKIHTDGTIEVEANLQGEVMNNLYAFDLGERILGLTTDPRFLNVLCEDPGASTLTDVSGKGHDGTYVGTWESEDRIKVGRNWMLDPNGFDAYITLGDDDDFSFGDASNDSVFTLFGIIEVGAETSPSAIASKEDKTTGTEKREWSLLINSLEEMKLELWDESAGVECSRVTSGVDPISVGKHSFAVTYDGSGGASAGDGITIYIDGVAHTSTATNNGSYVAMENTTTPAWIGARRGTATIDRHIKGDIGVFGIDASEWSAMTSWRFHQLCLSAYSEDGLTL